MKKAIIGDSPRRREDARLVADAERYGCEVLGATGFGTVSKRR